MFLFVCFLGFLYPTSSRNPFIASRISCDEVGKLSQTANKYVEKIPREFHFAAFIIHH